MSGPVPTRLIVVTPTDYKRNCKCNSSQMSATKPINKGERWTKANESSLPPSSNKS